MLDFPHAAHGHPSMLCTLLQGLWFSGDTEVWGLPTPGKGASRNSLRQPLLCLHTRVSDEEELHSGSPCGRHVL